MLKKFFCPNTFLSLPEKIIILPKYFLSQTQLHLKFNNLISVKSKILFILLLNFSINESKFDYMFFEFEFKFEFSNFYFSSSSLSLSLAKKIEFFEFKFKFKFATQLRTNANFYELIISHYQLKLLLRIGLILESL